MKEMGKIFSFCPSYISSLFLKLGFKHCNFVSLSVRLSSLLSVTASVPSSPASALFSSPSVSHRAVFIAPFVSIAVHATSCAIGNHGSFTTFSSLKFT
ncbi:hypothetical protein RJT34_11576 [Clitoria ternatea]|uniref:Uncharacterized protein n=1 Tax=Clitoria ternatea TaxID=43366 RepID=A0AAN9JMS5_CLITE